MAHFYGSPHSLDEAVSDTTAKHESTAASVSGSTPDHKPTTTEENLDSKSDEGVYVKGEPVISSGLDVSKHLVTTRDDGDTALTFRCVVLGTIFTALECVVGTMYMFKPGNVHVSGIFMTLLIFVAGEAWAHLTPEPERFGRPWVQSILRFLNCGQPFRIKEHVVATLIAGSGSASLPSVEVFAIQKLFYGQAVSPIAAVLGTFSISLCGFAIAGFLRPLCVYPAEMVYWGSLPGIALSQNLHFDRKANRERLIKCGWAGLAAAVWELFPAYMVPWLSGVSVFCLASAKASVDTRHIFTKVFGGASPMEGMGVLNFSFDWQYITSHTVSMPLKSQLNMWIGQILSYPCVAALYFGNVWGAEKFPFMSTSLFQSNGEQWYTSSVLDGRGTIDAEKLAVVGLPNLTSGSVWQLFMMKVAIGASITHVVLFHGKDMWKTWKSFRSRTQLDPHYRAMLKYAEAPFWWYLACYILTFFAGLVVVLKGETTLTPGTYVLAVLLGALLAPFAVTMIGLYGVAIPCDPLARLIGSAAQPNSPLANLFFSTWSAQVTGLAINLTHDLKVGQYMKIPPRVTFGAQIYGSLVGAALNYAVMTFIVSEQTEILKDPFGNNEWSGAGLQAVNGEAITWSLAKQMYSIRGKYALVPLGLVIGLLLPFIHWGIVKAFPKLKKLPINTAILAVNIGGTSGITSPLWSRMAVGMFSQVWLRRRVPTVYNKYNHLVGAALDGGSQLVMFVLAFTVQGASGERRPFPRWWGNPAGNRDHCLTEDWNARSQ